MNAAVQNDSAGVGFLMPNGSIKGMGGAPGEVDLFTNRLLNSGGDVNKLRTMSVLRENEWREYDTAVTTIARGRYSLVSDMVSAGMRRKLNSPLGHSQIVWDRSGDLEGAQIDMTGESADIKDRMEFAQDSMPVPLIHKGFSLNIRTLIASRKNGQGLDVSHAELATEKVVDMIEQLFLYGQFSAGAGAGTLYGMTRYPYRSTGLLSADWRLPSTTAAQVFNDVSMMVEALESKAQFGPYMLYIPRNYAPVMRKDYDGRTAAGGGGGSIEKRLMEISQLKGIKTNVFLPNNHVLLMQMTPSTAKMIDGFSPRLIEWSTTPMVYNFKVLAIQVPQIKRDALDQCGIAHFTI
jgi:hypothetical protein